MEPTPGTAALRVLFVDDDPRVLAQLEAHAKEREHWTAAFANSGERALALLEGDAFDLVVSDLAMPGIGGAELLARVRELAPQTARFICAEPASMSAMLAAFGPSHRWLSKPLDPDALDASLASTCALRSEISSARVVEIVTGTERLPSLPSLYREVTQAISEERSLMEIGQIIGRDVAMTAQILKLVNSSYFGLAQQCQDAARAVTLLGGEAVQALVLGAKVFEAFPLERASLLEEIWSRAQATTLFARMICRKEKASSELKNQVYIASFLHDVGLLLLAARPDLGKAPGEGVDWEGKDEHDAIGATHAQIGGYLLALWGFSGAVVSAVARHHRPPALEPAVTPLAVLHVAEAFARAQLAGARDVDDLHAHGLDLEALQAAGLAAKANAWIELLFDSLP